MGHFVRMPEIYDVYTRVVYQQHERIYDQRPWIPVFYLHVKVYY